MLKKAPESQAPEGLTLRDKVKAKRLAIGALVMFAGITAHVSSGHKTEANASTEPAHVLTLDHQTPEHKRTIDRLENEAFIQDIDIPEELK